METSAANDPPLAEESKEQGIDSLVGAFAEPEAAFEKSAREQKQNDGYKEQKGVHVKVANSNEGINGRLHSFQRLVATVKRHRPGIDPYTAALGEGADIANHHVLTRISRATRVGAATINAGAKSLGMTQRTEQRSLDKDLGDGGDASSLRTIAHVPKWARNMAKRRLKKSKSYIPLLTFRNPWPSYKPPGLFEAWHGGLRWGLPRGYEEGGVHDSAYRGRGKRAGALSRDDSIENVTVVKPTFAKVKEARQGSKSSAVVEEEEDHDDNTVRVTWLGHATTLVQFPGAEGLNILFDPIFVSRASPSQAAGPARFTKPPCTIEDLPRIDVVCISHNHYDHLSGECMRKLRKRENERQNKITQQRDSQSQASLSSEPGGHCNGEKERPGEHGQQRREDLMAENVKGREQLMIGKESRENSIDPKDLPKATRGEEAKCIKESEEKTNGGSDQAYATGLKVLCGLGNVSFFKDLGFQEDEIVECDWWDDVLLQHVSHDQTSDEESDREPKANSGSQTFRIVCAPAQHGSGRSAADQNVTLWASWLLIHGEGEMNTPRAAKDTEASVAVENHNASGFRVYFAGDTGLRAHDSSRKHRNHFPTCPVFEDVSYRFGVPQLLLLPISVGSSLSFFRSWDPFPRRFSPFPRVEAAMTSAIHMDAEDAAECHIIMSLAEQARQGDDGGRAQKARSDIEKRGVTSLAVHYGTFVRNETQTREDVRMLRHACHARDIAFIRPNNGYYDAEAGGGKGRFLVSNQGETVLVPIR